nr:MAG TPA: hypothetical protein [Caudoviricetes sp.]
MKMKKNDIKYENFIKEVVYNKAVDFVPGGFVYMDDIKINSECLNTSLLVAVRVNYSDVDYTLYYSDAGLISVDITNGENIYGATAYGDEPKTIEEIL